MFYIKKLLVVGYFPSYVQVAFETFAWILIGPKFWSTLYNLMKKTQCACNIFLLFLRLKQRNYIFSFE